MSRRQALAVLMLCLSSVVFASDESSGSLQKVPDHEFDALNAFMFVMIAVTCLGFNYQLKKRKWFWLPESGASMLFGLLVGGMISLFSSKEASVLNFDPELFFFVLLPPIIFEAGYTLKRRNFFRNMSTILSFAVFGTLVSTIIIGFSLFGLAKAGIVPLDSASPMESLMFGALISAVDPVATLSILGSKEVNADPMLYSLVFGESVLNDAVSIVLYKTFEKLWLSHVQHSASVSFWDAVGHFFGVSIGSIAIGCFGALFCSFMFKRSNLRQYPAYEFIVMFLFAYGTYCLAEIAQLSGIMALYFSGILMAHYTWFNISRVSQSSTHHVFKGLAVLAETFVFAYLGITAGISFRQTETYQWNGWFIVLALLLCFVSRAVNIFGFSYLANFKRKRPIPMRMQVMMWFAGLRGAIAFALALNVPSANKGYIITTTLFIVFFTTLVLGGTTEKLLTKLGLKAGLQQPSAAKSEDGSTPFISLSGDAAEDKKHKYGGLHKVWKNIDINYMKPWFGGEDPLAPNSKVVFVDGDEFSVQLPSEPNPFSPFDLHAGSESDRSSAFEMDSKMSELVSNPSIDSSSPSTQQNGSNGQWEDMHEHGI